MKSLRVTLVSLAATCGLLAALAVSTSAAGLANVIAVPDKPTKSGTLNLWNSPAAPYDTGQQIELQANFSGSPGVITLYKEGPANTWTAVGSLPANASGNAYFTYTLTSGAQRLYAETAGDLETEIDTLTGIDPVPQTGVLDAPSSNGKTWTAHFTPGVAGKTSQLQIQRIPTKETDEVNSTDPAKPDDATKGPWVTISTAKQNAAGDVGFIAPSPYPYRVAHNYRVVAGANVSNVQAFGLGQVTPKNSGLSAVYFNTNEGHGVDTRTHYFEGEFSMTASSKLPECGAVNSSTIPELKNSVMKGRGNYSWSFRRKSFTLKLGKKADLCGMGSNKKWALVANDYDKSLMRNSLAGYLGSKLTNLSWTPKSRPVDLYVNGSYRGNYLLIERVSIDPTRVNVPELKGGEKTCPVGGTKTPDDQSVASHPNNVDPCITGGYILEWDFRKGADYNAYLGSDSGYVGVKDPENDLDRSGAVTKKGISSYQKNYIRDYLNTVDSTLRGSGYTNDTTGWKKYIDEASAVDYYIGMEYMKPVDGNMWASVYMYKQRDSAAGAGDGKLFFGPLWDFDLSSGSANRAGNVVSSSGFYLKSNLNTGAQQSTKTWFHRLNEDADFRAAVKARWNAIKGSIDTTAYLNSEKAIIDTSADQTYASFSHSYRISTVQVIKSNFDADFSYLRSWAASRESWLNSSSGFN
ncbi:MAG: hypothetical protein QOH68_735 [Nocardioidaceae bacterium]|jgi:hypothetical protein|nr:hypothetical protein [Nocardioidaceae bacterium]